MTLTASAYTQVFGTTEFAQGIHGICKTVIDGRVLFVFGYTFGTDLYKAVVIDINGTKTGVLVGTATNVDVGEVDQQFSDIDVAPLTADGSDGAVYYMDDVSFNHNIEANTFSIDGSRNITMNTVLEIPTDSGQEDHVAIDRIDDTHLFVVHQKWVSGGARVNCYILTESSGTLTASSALTLDSDADPDSKVSCVVLSSTRAFAFYEGDDDGCHVALINISGANPTLTDGPDQIESSTAFDYVHYHKISGKIDSTHAVIAYQAGATIKMRIIRDNSDTINIGASVTDNSSGNRISVATSDDGERVAVGHRSGGTIRTYKVVGETLSQNGDEYTLPNNPTPNAPLRSTIAFAQMDGTDYLWISVHDDTDGTLWAAQIRDDPLLKVSLNTLTLAGSAESLSIYRTQLMQTLTLVGSAEFITQNIIALNTLTLVASAEFITQNIVAIFTLTLAGSAETLFPHIPSPMQTLTLTGSAESLTVAPGAISVVVNTLTLVSSPPALGVGSNATVALNTLTLASSTNVDRVQTFIFNPTQVANMRETSHKSTARLTIFSPPVLWSGIIDGVHDQGAVTLTYVGGAGSLTFVRDYQQLIVGTAPGKDDIARLRIDDVASMLLATGSLDVDENAVKWVSGLYIAIEHLYPIERINPRLAGGVLYKYYDVAYVDQNGQDETNPVCLAGSDQVAELVAGSHVFDIDLSASYPTTAGVIVSYSLSVAPTSGAVVVFDTGTGIGTVTVSQSGYWWATCSCTDSFGPSMERFVLLRAHDATDTDFYQATINSYSETWGGGVKMSITSHEAILLSDVPDNAIAYLWHKNEFDDTEGYVNILGTQDTILFNGYIRSDRGRSDLKTGDQSASFQLTTVDGLMQNLPLRSITVRLKSMPTDWWQYQLLTTGEAIWFLFRWHSTVPWRHDMIGLRSFDKFVRRVAADFEEGTIFNMANQVAFSKGVIAKVTCDRLGRLHFVRDSQLLNQSDRDSIVSAFDITEEDVAGTIETIRQPEPKVHTMQISGFSYSSTGTGTPYIAIIPGYRQAGISYSLPERRGTSFRNIPHQLLASQTEANERVGRYFAQANMPIKELRIPFRGNYISVLTTIPSYGWYELNVANTSVARTLELNKIRMLCRQIDIRLDSRTGTFTTTGIFEPEAIGPDGIVGNYPGAQPPPEDPVLESEDALAELLLATGSVDSRITFPLSEEGTQWLQHSATTYNHAAIDPWWRIKNTTEDAAEFIWVACGDGIIDIGDEKAATITDIRPTTNPPNGWSDVTAPTVADMVFTEILADLYIQDHFFCVAEWQETDSGDNLWRTWIAYTTDAGTTWTWYDLYEFYSRPTAARIRNIAVNGTYLLMTMWQAEALGVDYFRAVTKFTFLGAYNAKVTDLGTEDPTTSDEVAYVTTVYDDDTSWYLFGSGINVSPASNNLIVATTISANSTSGAVTGDAGATWRVFDAQGGRITALRIGDLIEGTTTRKHWALKK